MGGQFAAPRITCILWDQKNPEGGKGNEVVLQTAQSPRRPGAGAYTAAQILGQVGFPNVRVLEGGMIRRR